MNKIYILPAMAMMVSATASASDGVVSDTTVFGGIHQLEQVVVTGNGHHEKLKNSTTPVSVLTASDIAKTGVTDFQQALQRLMPNVQLAPSSMGSFIRLNGLGNKYILILVNGQKVIGDISTQVDLNQINLGAVKRIEVLNGAASALYGSDAIGGVINIITDQPKDKLLRITSDTHTGSNGQLTENVSLDINYKWISSYTRFSHNELNSFRNNGYAYKGAPEGDVQPTLQTLVLGYNNNFVDQRLEFRPLRGLSLYGEGSYNYKLTNRPRKQTGFASGYDYEMRFKTMRWTAGGQYIINRNHILNIDFLSHNFRYGNEYTSQTKSKGKVTHEIGDYTQSKKQQLYDLNLKSTNHFYSGSTTIFGAEYKNNFINTTTGNIVKHQYNISAYGQHDTKIAGGLSGTAGLRYDYNEDFGSHLTPKAALLYKVDGWTFRANYAMGFRAPGLDELYYHYFSDKTSGHPLVTFGNKDLKPENSNYIGITAGYSNRIVSVEVTGFANYVNDMIVKQAYNIDDAAKEMLKAQFPDEITDASFNTLFTYNRYINSDKGIVRGVNAGLNVNPVGGLTLSVNYSYINARTKNAGEWIPLERSVHNTVTIAANYIHTWWDKYTLNVNINGRMQGKTYYPGYENAPGYGVWNLNTSHTVVVSKWLSLEPSLGIDNIFNQVDRRIYWTNRRYANFSSGTSVVFGLKVIFD